MKKFAVIGHPIAHSLSPIIHNFLFSYLGMRAAYKKIEILQRELLQQALFSLDGANITLPYKEDVYRLCNKLEGMAQEIEAVNTVIREKDGLVGFNTDSLGFWKCVENLGVRNALVLGAGGSAKAIAIILQKMGVEVCVYARNEARHPFFIQKKISVSSEIDLKHYDLIVNATSAGIDMEKLPLQEILLESLLKKTDCVFDVIYPSSFEVKNINDFKSFIANRHDTHFLSFAKRFSIQRIDGLEMLLFQALFAFEIFSRQSYSFEELRALFYNS